MGALLSGLIFYPWIVFCDSMLCFPIMGLLFINAVQFVDIPIMSAYLIMVSFIFVMINFIVDIAYYFIDPRIRFKEEAVTE